MCEIAMGLAIASIIYNIVLTIRVRSFEAESLFDKHMAQLSQETIKDIIENAVPETDDKAKK
jgi:hypothetical protein